LLVLLVYLVKAMRMVANRTYRPLTGCGRKPMQVVNGRTMRCRRRHDEAAFYNSGSSHIHQHQYAKTPPTSTTTKSMPLLSQLIFTSHWLRKGAAPIVGLNATPVSRIK
jgi:hypothetical protein